MNKIDSLETNRNEKNRFVENMKFITSFYFEYELFKPENMKRKILEDIIYISNYWYFTKY